MVIIKSLDAIYLVVIYLFDGYPVSLSVVDATYMPPTTIWDLL